MALLNKSKFLASQIIPNNRLNLKMFKNIYVLRELQFKTEIQYKTNM